MRLEKVILNGFKSFADKTQFVFAHPITAVVGPNGCGKSNVVDAVKWVLGEQKVKSLRSEQMTDVIFNGSTSRKPLNAAEVTLVISNPPAGNARRLPIDTDMVEITRKVYRSGEGEYRINGKVCRLRDIRELLMGTGLGTRAYSIIEQGQVEQIVTASTVDRRQIFEEAAGISRYKLHKKEALRRLEHTEQNLLRLADILGEVTKRLRSVKVQAARARTYLEYTSRLKQLQLNYALADYSRNHQQIQAKRQSLEQACDVYAKLSADLAKTELQVSQINQAILKHEHALNDLGNKMVAITGRIEQGLQKIELLRTRQQELEQARSTRAQQVLAAQQQLNLYQSELAGHLAQLDQTQQATGQLQAQISQDQEQARQLEGRIAALEAELKDEKAGIIDIVRRTAQLHNEIRSLSDFRASLAQQKEKLADRARIAIGQLEQVLAEKAQHQARLEDIDKVLQELQENLQVKRQEADAIEQQISQWQQELAQAKEQRSALGGQLEVLVQMEQRYEGLNSQVKAILQGKATDRQAFSCVLGILAQIVETDLEYAPAVEAALEGLAEAVIVTDLEALLGQIEAIGPLHGRVRFFSRDQFPCWSDQIDTSRFPGVVGKLVEFVRFRPEYAPMLWRLLGKTIVVEDLQSGLGLANVLGDEYRIVTVKGEVIEPGRGLALGPVGKASGLISRKSLMRRLEKDISVISAQIEQLQTQIACNQQTHAHLSKLCRDLRTAIYEANTEKVQVSSKLAALEQTIARLQQEQPLIASEMGMLEAQITESVRREYQSKQRLAELEAVSTQRNTRIAQLESELAGLQQDYQAKMAALTDQRVRLGQITEQARSIRQTIDGIRGQINNASETLKTAQQEASQAAEQIAQTDRSILQTESAISDLYMQKDQLRQSCDQLKDQIQLLLQQHRQAEEALRQYSQQKAQFEQQVNDLRVELAQLEVRQQDLVARIKEELQIDLAEAYASYNQQECDWQQVQEEIADLRSRLERLGTVNLEAIDEQDELEQRCQFLTRQLEDLQSSKAQLQQLIAKLNRECQERFTQTFEQIREHFQQIFRKLFGGGRADVILEEAEDQLEAGVEVIARPPGKETRSISLLSGGEKSMTALALLFAVFRARPSPFCFLDEVDAALDEANNERFNLLVKEFQADTQFIVITHSKRTMRIADELIGITMQVQGVSKKISVRFEECRPQQAVA
ncbi:MAG: chromosome segregation protein SMC [Sedimentisphaerales bacterium]|nr:chromosome segregation protein SMC [Sedimentisphaerales bacterium]